MSLVFLALVNQMDPGALVPKLVKGMHAQCIGARFQGKCITVHGVFGGADDEARPALFQTRLWYVWTRTTRPLSIGSCTAGTGRDSGNAGGRTAPWRSTATRATYGARRGRPIAPNAVSAWCAPRPGSAYVLYPPPSM